VASPTPSAGWYPDPYGRHEVRFWDGARWTEHAASGGSPVTDAPDAAGAVPRVRASDRRLRRQVTRQAGLHQAAFVGGGTLFDEPVLVVNQRAGLTGATSEFAIFAPTGVQLGAVRRVGPRDRRGHDGFTLQITDVDGNVQLVLTRPPGSGERLHLASGMGSEIGWLVRREKGHFAFESGGYVLGVVEVVDRRRSHYRIVDWTGVEVARLTKTFAGVLKSFTAADHYVVELHRLLEDPLLSLVVASAVCVDALEFS
jgi:hypothetical protein